MRGYAEDAAEQWKLILRTGPFRQWQIHDAAKRNGNIVCSTDPLSAGGLLGIDAAELLEPADGVHRDPRLHPDSVRDS